MKTYRGQRNPCGRNIVTVDGRPLGERHDLRNHGPDGFEWGYGGSGPAQLALAIATDHFGDERGQQLYQDLKWALVARIVGDTWELTSAAIDDWYANAAELLPEGGPR